MFLGKNDKYWQEVIDSFYKKYHGGAAWHRQIVNTAQTTGKLTIPSGRYFPFSPVMVDGKYVRDRSGSLKWPITQIKNYPVQGFGADLVMLARLEAFKLYREAEIEAKFVGTIHDSIVVDCSDQVSTDAAKLLLRAIERVPKLCREVWGYTFKVPITAEVQVGRNKLDMEELKGLTSA